MIQKDIIIKEFELKPFGNKGFLKSKKLPCPFCGKSDKFALKFDDKKGGGFNCFHASCNKKGSMFSLLKEIGRLDLFGEKEYSNTLYLKILDINGNREEKKEIKTKSSLPIGFREFTEIDDYLKDRGFTEYHRQMFKPGYTNVDLKLVNYTIFQLFLNNERVGYLARSKHSKEWHKENIRLSKEGLAELKLRYNNSSDVDFENILGGYDHIGDATTLILVEGLFDKVGVDNKLNLPNNPKIKCCFQFGVSLSDEHIKLLQKTKVKKIILLYDYNTHKSLKKSSMKLSRYFDVKIAEITEDYDPGNIPFNLLKKTLENLQSPFDFYKNKLDNLQFFT